MQWTTYLCNEQLTCAMNNLLVQWTTYWCNEQLTCAMNNLLVQWIISQIFESTLSQFFYLTNTTFRLFFYLKHGQTWVGFCRSVFFVKYFYFFTKKLTVQKYLLLLALSEHELQAQEYVIKVVLFFFSFRGVIYQFWFEPERNRVFATSSLWLRNPMPFLNHF